MLCCQNCFNDKFLKTYIKTEGSKNTCKFCESINIYCLPPKKLSEFFLSIANLYIPVEKSITSGQKHDDKSNFIWDKIHDDWNIFSERIKDKRKELFNCILLDQITEGLFKLLELPYEIAGQFYGVEDEEAKRLEDDWNEFSEEMKSRNRFFPSIKINLEQLKHLLQYLDHKIEANTVFFRSRKTTMGQKFSPSNMGKPPAYKTKNGRANPIGIPYLYLASDLDTAIAEIRPSMNDKITVGEFQLSEPISIIDLINVSPFPFLEDEDFENLITKIGYLKKLGADLSKPINPKDEELEYLPTQYLCEFIKNCGWEGVVYNSSLANGYNLAIFKDGKINCTKTDLYLIGKTTLSYEKLI